MAEQYSTDQVQQILVQALERNLGEEEGFSRSQLEEMATDLGISSEALARAEQSYQELPAAIPPSSEQMEKRNEFHRHLRTYAVVNGFLLTLNIILSGTITWAIYPLLGWGMGLLLPKQSSLCTRDK
ncbi:MAG: 2TM domain-containing protein [Cyanobacteria bacterium J06638_22]